MSWIICRSARPGTLLFHLLSKLYEHTSAAITTNLSFAEWSSVFGDAKMTTALLDRLTYHCHIVPETGNESYQLQQQLGCSVQDQVSRTKTPGRQRYVGRRPVLTFMEKKACYMTACGRSSAAALSSRQETFTSSSAAKLIHSC